MPDYPILFALAARLHAHIAHLIQIHDLLKGVLH